MVITWCISAANKTANHSIFNRSDVVSAIGAFAVGLLENVYSRLNCSHPNVVVHGYDRALSLAYIPVTGMYSGI
jgi:uncharacterized membrane protein YjjB (DUF3815 family)